MALSKHRKTHTIKVAARYQELVEMRLAAGLTRTGHTPKKPLADTPKRVPIRNPKRLHLTKSQKKLVKKNRYMMDAL